jgi:hypothetical protein
MKKFKVGQVVWVESPSAKPVVCKCCGIQKYLKYHPRVIRYVVSEIHRYESQIIGTQVVSLKDSRGAYMTATSYDGDTRFHDKRVDAWASSKIHAASMTKTSVKMFRITVRETKENK